MIKLFKCKETKKIFHRTYAKKFPRDMQRSAFKKLRMLNRANILNDLRVPPANHLESLHGDRKGQYSIGVNDQWRICFKWSNGEATKVELLDYH